MKNFTVLLSVYKNESPKFLEEAIESVSALQTKKAQEIVLIKDGKLTNELEKTILALKKRIPYLKTFGYDNNRGLGYSLNYGLAKCKNELIFRMDTDDIAHPKRFEKQLKFLETNPELSIIGSTIQEFIKSPGDLDKKRTVPSSPESIELRKNIRNPFNHMTVLFKKSDVQNVGGYIDMPGYEDYYLWLRLLKKYKGANIGEPLVFARIGNNMIGRRQGIEYLIKEIKFQNALIKERLIDLPRYYRNIIVRGLPRILPIFILQLLYQKLLRK